MHTPAHHLTTRRQFLRTGVLGGALGWTVPAFLSQTFETLHAAAAGSATGRDGRILVVMQLAGGNDGLNTLVPYANDHYRKARPRLGIAADKVLKINAELGLHDACAPLKSLYDEGHAAFIQSVGYPNPNRSHFRSTEIWHTATPVGSAQHGWVGRYFDHACKGADPTVGVALSRQSPQVFANANSLGISIQGGRGGAAAMMDDESGMYMAGDEADAAGGSIGSSPGMAAQEIQTVDFLERMAMNAQVGTEQIARLAKEGKNETAYPNGGLSADLAMVARLIAGGMPTRIYYVSQGGYDTHRDQPNAHARLLGEFSTSMGAFIKDLKTQGNLDRVTVLTFSEFGRRVAENASQGTDHGAAAPAFIFGGKISPGLLGAAPLLGPDQLVNGDIAHQIDFRSLYASLLINWLGVPASASPAILGGNFAPLPLGFSV